MKNIFKILMAIMFLPLVLQSCREEDYSFSDTPAPSFKLYDPSVSSNVLYSSMAKNPFTLVWDESMGSTKQYNVVFSSTADFQKPVVLGTTDKTTFTTNIETLNSKLLQAGYAPYTSQGMYIRVETATTAGAKLVSNVIRFDVTPYPSSVPVITAPVAGSTIVLLKAAPEDEITKVTWSDYTSYGVDVLYTIEVAKKGTTNWVTLGTAKNEKTLSVSNKMFNDAVLKAGLKPDVAEDIDIRITASTKSVGGTIEKVSAPVTVNVKPYVAFKNMYLVGEATAAGWDTNNNNQALFRDPANFNKFYFTGYFNAGGFKVVEVLGEWQPQWGQKNGVVAVNEGGGSDPDTFNIPQAGYYTFEMDIVAKTYSITPYDATGKATYTTIGLIGDATPNGWDSDTDLTKSTFDPHQWYVGTIALTAKEAKFRAENGWDINWGNNTPLSGVATSGGPNIPVPEAGNYKVFFNDLDGRYQFIKL